MITDAERMVLVLTNVLNKAVELSERGGSIQIDSWAESEQFDAKLFFKIQFLKPCRSENEKGKLFSDLEDSALIGKDDSPSRQLEFQYQD